MAKGWVAGGAHRYAFGEGQSCDGSVKSSGWGYVCNLPGSMNAGGTGYVGAVDREDRSVLDDLEGHGVPPLCLDSLGSPSGADPDRLGVTAPGRTAW